MMKREIKKNKGFSLVELIIVIAIMVILGAIIAPQYFKYVKNANIASDVEQAARISTAISSEYASQASGATGDVTLDTTNAWTGVAKISDLVGTVSESKVLDKGLFYYRLNKDGEVEIGISATVPVIGNENGGIPTTHVISPLNDAAKDWTRK